ncbi:hypothetical protein J6TS7_61600 [Paenibacillus dendritiformis]|nr:hypothetical protein J6TS7_61600 [Paenibacillus dendritiformis]
MLMTDDREDLRIYEHPENFITLTVNLDGNGYVDNLTVGDLNAFIMGKQEQAPALCEGFFMCYADWGRWGQNGDRLNVSTQNRLH